VDQNELLAAIANRTIGESFGYGITTADRYVRHAVDTCGPMARYCDDALLKRAAGTLVFCDAESIVGEKRRDGKFGDILPEKVAAPENTLMVFQHVVTTPREDRDTDILVTEGAMLDPRAPLLWQHVHTLPLGKVLTTIDHTKDVLRVATALLDVNDLTRDAAALLEADVLRISHGFRALEFEERKRESGYEGFPGFKITKFEIMEVSLVSVPSNVDAEVEMFSAGKLTSDMFKAHAKHYFDQRPVVVPGATLDDEPETDETESEKSEPDDETKTVDGPTFNGERIEFDQPVDVTAGGYPLPEEFEKALAALDEAFAPIRRDIEVQINEKAGRVLSARNVSALKDVIEDLDELSGSDGLSRAQTALIGRCISRLKTVLKEADKPDDDEDKPDNKPKPKPKPDDGDDEGKQTSSLTFVDAFAYMLANATDDQLQRMQDAINARFSVAESDRRASAYRAAIGGN